MIGPYVAVGQSVVGDFNGDGNLDMAVLQPTGVAILLGKGDGTFTTGASVAIPSNPWSIGNGGWGLQWRWQTRYRRDHLYQSWDRHPAGQRGWNLTLAPSSVSSAYIAAEGPLIAVGDFNGDGKLDIAIATGYNTISIFLGNGNGTFTAGPTVGLPADGPEDYAVVIQVGDFNGDGKLDMAVSGIDSDYVTSCLAMGMEPSR